MSSFFSYRVLRDDVDARCGRLAQRYRRHLVCHAGCSSCCRHHLSVFEVEAAVLRQAIARLPEMVRERLRQQASRALEASAAGEPESCPLLLDECCAVYDDRPVICRTQGLPLLIVADDGGLEVDFCPLNFTAPGAIAELDEELLIPLEKLNRELVLANLEYCRAAGLADSGTRIRVGVLAAAPGQENRE
jgi:hypothetical protein